MRFLFLLLLVVFPLASFGQVALDTTATDKRYLEDQFYAGFTYNFILNRPDGVSQRNFSYGLQLGFIKDIPLNKERNIGLGLGLGLALNTYYTNMRAIETSEGINYIIPDDNEDFKRSKVETHLLEVPFQFRWRNSTPTAYSFWRIYTGVKLGYAFDSRSKFVIDSKKQSFTNNDIRKLHYGLTLNFGYHNFNVHVYYSLTELFNDGVLLDTQNINMKPLQVGFMFYFL